MGRIQYRGVSGTEHTKEKAVGDGIQSSGRGTSPGEKNKERKKIVAILCSCASFSLGKLREFIFDHFV